MAGSSVLTLRLDPKLKKQLDRLSEATNRSRSFVAAEAIREYVALNPTRADKRAGSFKINLQTGRWADFAADSD